MSILLPFLPHKQCNSLVSNSTFSPCSNSPLHNKLGSPTQQTLSPIKENPKNQNTEKKSVNALGPTDVAAFTITFIVLVVLSVNIKLTYCPFLGTASPIFMIQSDLCFINISQWSVTRLWELWQL